MKRALRAAAVLATVLVLASCQELFTTSLGAWASRDTLTVPADLGAADALALASEAVADGDAQLAAALLPALSNNLDAATPGTPAYDELAAAAAETVVVASGISEAITAVIELVPVDQLGSGTATLDPATVAAIDAIMDGVVVGADAEAILASLAVDPGAASADQLVLAALALVVADNPDLSLAGLLDGTETAPDLTGTLAEDLLAAAVAQASADPVDGSLLALFGGLLDPALLPAP